MMYLYKLKFLSSLHIGENDIEYTEDEKNTGNINHTISSDTLYSAILFVWSLLFDDNIEELINNLPFRISSTFPYFEDDKINKKFYPIPIGSIDNLIKKGEDNIKDDIKKLKKIDFIEEDIFLEYFNNKKNYVNNIKKLIIELKKSEKDKCKPIKNCDDKKNRNSPSNYYKNYKLNYCDSFERPRTKIDRLKNTVIDEGFYYSVDLYFKKNSGLFFLVEFDENKNIEKFIKKFDSVLRLLGDNGIGADRSIGKGIFIFKKEEFNKLKLVKNNIKDYVLLSSYLPSKEEIEKGVLDNSSYKLSLRSGHPDYILAKNLTMKNLMVLTSGSVIKYGYEIKGKKVKVINKDEAKNKNNIFIPFDIYRIFLPFIVKINGV